MYPTGGTQSSREVQYTSNNSVLFLTYALGCVYILSAVSCGHCCIFFYSVTFFLKSVHEIIDVIRIHQQAYLAPVPPCVPLIENRKEMSSFCL